MTTSLYLQSRRPVNGLKLRCSCAISITLLLYTWKKKLMQQFEEYSRQRLLLSALPEGSFYYQTWNFVKCFFLKNKEHLIAWRTMREWQIQKMVLKRTGSNIAMFSIPKSILRRYEQPSNDRAFHLTLIKQTKINFKLSEWTRRAKWKRWKAPKEPRARYAFGETLILMAFSLCCFVH